MTDEGLHMQTAQLAGLERLWREVPVWADGAWMVEKWVFPAYTWHLLTDNIKELR